MSVLHLFFALFFFAVLFSIKMVAPTYSASATAKDRTIGPTVISDKTVDSLGADEGSPKWFVFEETLGWTRQENYSSLSYTQFQAGYGSGVVTSGYCNEELFSVTGVDNTGASSRLIPVDGVSASNNINANGQTTITIEKIMDPRGDWEICSDILWNNDLCSDFHINASGSVGNGKILYRSTDGQNFGGWSYRNLVDGASMVFIKDHVQIAIIYELYAHKKWFWEADRYLRIAGVYRFDIM